MYQLASRLPLWRLRHGALVPLSEACFVSPALLEAAAASQGSTAATGHPATPTGGGGARTATPTAAAAPGAPSATSRAAAATPMLLTTAAPSPLPTATAASSAARAGGAAATPSPAALSFLLRHMPLLDVPWRVRLCLEQAGVSQVRLLSPSEVREWLRLQVGGPAAATSLATAGPRPSGEEERRRQQAVADRHLPHSFHQHLRDSPHGGVSPIMATTGSGISGGAGGGVVAVSAASFAPPSVSEAAQLLAYCLSDVQMVPAQAGTATPAAATPIYGSQVQGRGAQGQAGSSAAPAASQQSIGQQVRLRLVPQCSATRRSVLLLHRSTARCSAARRSVLLLHRSTARCSAARRSALLLHRSTARCSAWVLQMRSRAPRRAQGASAVAAQALNYLEQFLCGPHRTAWLCTLCPQLTNC